jgi:hypothetical protein
MWWSHSGDVFRLVANDGCDTRFEILSAPANFVSWAAKRWIDHFSLSRK